MIKKIFFLCVILIFLLFLYLKQNIIMFVYLNPYTYSAPFGYISETITNLDKAFRYAQSTSARNGNRFKYIFYNAYGSGFIRGNNIPNDLDFAIGIDLGRYKFDGTNARGIADSIVRKANDFETSFNFYINMEGNANILITKTPFEVMQTKQNDYSKNVNDIADNLETSLSGKNYIKHTNKQLEKLNIEIPYIMKSGEILLENREPITLYSNSVSYNSQMPRYYREISIIPEYFVTIDFQGKKHLIEIVPESFLGERLQLSRRFFASGVFVHNRSVHFLKRHSFIKNDEEYLYIRMLSFKRHLQEINNILTMKDRPVKLLKRLAQTADIIYPLLDDSMYAEIKSYTAENLNSPNIRLLNEYSNICGNIISMSKHKKLFDVISINGGLKTMQGLLNITVQALEESGNINKKTLVLMSEFAKSDLNNTDEMTIKYEKISEAVNAEIYSQIIHPEKIPEFISVFNQTYKKAGYHKVTLYWLNNDTIGVLEDNFTKNIKDFSSFAKENNLIDVHYVLIPYSKAPAISMRYDVYARYNADTNENKYLEDLRSRLLNDRKNFGIKRALILNPQF